MIRGGNSPALIDDGGASRDLPLTGGTLTGALEIDLTAIGTGTTAGATVKNTTAAAAGAQQYSPMVVLTGAGWKTDATAASQTVDFALQTRPVQGAAAPTGALHWLSQVNVGGWTSRMNLDTAGALTIGQNTITPNGGVATPQVNATAALDYALNTQNGGMRAKGSFGFDGYDAADLIIGATTATGVRVGKSGGKVGFYGTSAIALRAGQVITNNVTSGGTTGTIPDITNGTVYATDYANLRAALYQLALGLKTLDDTVRALGLQT